MAATALKRNYQDQDGGVLDKHVVRAVLSPKIAHSLFTGMVADKLSYPIRELGKNASEVSPKGKPWHLKLPSVLDTRVVFRDFGPGLSPHFMKYRFAKLGESTRDKNGVNGLSGLGYGSKSPLAVLIDDGKAGSYNVTSHQGGVSRYYVISLTDRGDIQIKLLAEVETSEPDGLEVSFDIPVKDIEAFCEAAYRVLWSFEPRPVITPAPDATWSNPVILTSDDGWTRYRADSVPWSGPQVRVDRCVMYPIDLDLIDGASDFVSGDECIVFEVDKDAVDATSSREALQYTSKTKENIKNTILEYARVVVRQAQDDVEKEPTYFKALVKLKEHAAKYSKGWGNLLKKEVTWNNRKLDNFTIHSHDEYKIDTLIEGWKILTGFRNEKDIVPTDIDGAEIVVQVGTDRSFERFEKLGLVGKKIVWFRVLLKDKAAFLARFALKPGDYHDLNTVKLPPRIKGVPVANTIRKLPSVSMNSLSNGDISITEVDISRPTFYLVGEKHSRKHHKTRYSVDFLGTRRLNNDHFIGETVRLLIESKQVGHLDREVVVVKSDFVIPDNWTEFSNFALERLKAFFDINQTGQKEVGRFDSVNSIIRRLVKIGEYPGFEFPSDIQVLVDRGLILKTKSSQNRHILQSIHDKILDLFVIFGIHTKTQVPTEVQDFEQEFNNLIDTKYLLIKSILKHDPYRIEERDDVNDHLRYYFKLINLAHPLIS